MRYLILIVSLAMAGSALAEETPKSVVKELDKSSLILMTAEEATDSSGVNDPKGHAVVSPRDAASGRPTGKRTHATPAEGADYNSSRSNKTHGLAGSGNPGSSGSTRAQDYNSSRSNTTAAREDSVGDLDGDGRPDLAVCRDGMDNDCDDADDRISPANHNTTRSNRTLQDAAVDGETGKTRAQDYNSSRSNTTSTRLDTDSDGDSLKEVRCSMRNGDCVDAGNGDDPVVRKKPGAR